MAAAAVPANLAAALRYGPQTQSSVRRSEYLSDALKRLSEDGGKITGGYGELGAKLLATAILQRAGKKADAAAVTALRGDQDAETERMLTALRGPQAAAPQPAPPIQLPPQASAPAPALQPAPTANTGPSLADPTVRRLAQLAWHEARGEPAIGQAGVAAVAMNRAKASGRSLDEVVFAPNQFTGFTPERAQSIPDAELAKVLPNIAQALAGNDPTGGADHFYNPSLANPAWGQGDGQMIGQHKFMKLGYGGQHQQMASAVPPPPPPPDPNGPDVQQSGAGSDPFPPSAPVSSPPAAGSPAAGPLPQAGPAAAGPASLGITAGQLALAEQLLRDPRTHEAGVAYVSELQKKAAEPTKFETQNVNGVPTWLDPYHPGKAVTGDVPVQSRDRLVTAESIGYPAPPGTMLSISPTGQVKEVGRPQQGQMVASPAGGPYRETPIPGSTNDPHAPANVLTQEGKLRDDYEKQIQPYIVARQGYQKVVEAAKTGNPAGDIALVFGYMKTLDPTSTVREGEQAQVANSGTIPQTVTNIYNQLVTGQGKLSPEQRAQFADSARRQFGVYQDTADQLNKRFGDLSTSYGFDASRVVRSFDPIAPFTPPDAGRTPIGEAARTSYQRLFQQGRINPQAPVGTQANPYQARDEATLHALDTPANRGKWVITPNGDLGEIH